MIKNYSCRVSQAAFAVNFPSAEMLRNLGHEDLLDLLVRAVVGKRGVVQSEPEIPDPFSWRILRKKECRALRRTSMLTWSLVSPRRAKPACTACSIVGPSGSMGGRGTGRVEPNPVGGRS
ncbi:hypothetical protein GCM10012286_21670 [Streptomyces lasiicapitis]|uniref:Uncharacterized protein n=1 Tax=Streptomyces lasiicapitis TaxID=1923961 RepID=A0ABQ2LPU2_9ACTN|nr:hypothetical protein GCM10012286_21670 [Streptomyces lasiicapitis]